MTIAVILGMHRSGTSFLTHSLHEAGLYLGADLQTDVARDNLDGHWESREAMRINDRVLLLSGGSWLDVPAVLRGDDETDRSMAAFVESLTARAPAGWKDPRTTVTFPLWKPFLTNYRIIAALRHPMSVARSLETREQWPVERGLRLWTEYNEHLLRHVDGEDVLWFDYDAPSAALSGSVRAICEKLGLRFEERVAQVFNPYLRHREPEEITDSRAEELYHALRDRARTWIEQNATTAAEVSPDSVPRRLEQLGRVQAMHNAALQTSLSRDEARVRFDGLHSDVVHVDARVSNLEAALNNRISEVYDHLAALYAHTEAVAPMLQADFPRLAHQLMQARRSRPYRMARAAYRGTRRGLGVLKRGIGRSPVRAQQTQEEMLIVPKRIAAAPGTESPAATLNGHDPSERLHLENEYYDEQRMEQIAAVGGHRHIVGDLWDEMGKLQFEFLVGQGLRPEHRLLDLGCGCLRGGVHFVRYLSPGHYYGLDLSRSLLDAGLQEIASLGLAEKLPRENLICDAEFDASGFGTQFDYALAQSVFTHLSFNHLRLCLNRLAPHMAGGGKFFVTFFEVPDVSPIPDEICHGKITTFAARDPFHYSWRDLEYAAAGSSWKPVYIGAWDHPRGQHIMYYEMHS